MLNCRYRCAATSLAPFLFGSHPDPPHLDFHLRLRRASQHPLQLSFCRKNTLMASSHRIMPFSTHFAHSTRLESIVSPKKKASFCFLAVSLSTALLLYSIHSVHIHTIIKAHTESSDHLQPTHQAPKPINKIDLEEPVQKPLPKHTMSNKCNPSTHVHLSVYMAPENHI